MPSILYHILHPSELRSIIQWTVWHNAPHERNPANDPPTLKKCFEFLDLTSRSFAAVILELHPDLLVPICVFYLILRGLDTIEDDMTLSASTKEPLLRNFHNILDQDGWTFDGCGPAEKDRELLVQFHNVIAEFKKIRPAFQVIIKDITQKMGDGMADSALKAERNDGFSVDSIDDYELYCHYVAGLVGEGLTRLFVEAGLANPVLLSRPDLYESMGQFLQQTNIIRDIREDMEDKRRFWPKAVWTKYVDRFEDLFKPENEEKALRCSSEMVLLALKRATDSMFYLAALKEQSVFNFAAIPQSMAIATMELCFRNRNIFEKNVKITRGQACQLMTESSQDLKTVYEVFRRYARKIHKKNNPLDPNFLKVSVECGKIEQFMESIFPSQDPQAVVRNANGGRLPNTPEQEAHRKLAEESGKADALYLILAIFGAIFVMAVSMFLVAWAMGARFDLVFAEFGNTYSKLFSLFTDSGSGKAVASPSSTVTVVHQRVVPDEL